MTRAVLAFPGDLDTPTGGYAYDRQVLRALPRHGVDVTPLALPRAFPFPAAGDLAETARLLGETPADALLFIDGLGLGALPASLLRATGRTIVALIHHPLAREAGLSPEQQAALEASEREALAMCAGVVATSAATGRDLVANYGVPPERFTIAEPGVAPAPRAAAQGEPPHILAIGSVIPRKNYAGLVAALAGVADLGWTATFIGSLDFAPETVAEVRSLIAAHDLAARIRLAGAVPAEALEAAYAGCDLFVHAALYEGYGMVLADALRRGLPMIASTGGAAGDTVPDGSAVKVPPGDTPALTAALRALLSDRSARLRLADAAAEAGAHLPGWDDTARTIAQALKQASRSPTP